MTMYDKDPDVVYWGLDGLDVCSISNAGSCGSVTQHQPDLSSVQYVRVGYVESEQPGYVEAEQPSVENGEIIEHAFREELIQLDAEEASGELEQSGYVESEQRGYVEAEQPIVENDEIIAHALQEEFSRLAVKEASGASTYGNEQLQASVLTQDWLAPSKRYADSKGQENDQQLKDRKDVEAQDELGNANSCSSPGEKSGSDNDLDMLHLADESVLDGEVGKRLNEMMPVPHMPKINGEIPSVEEQVSDHQRLLDRLQLYYLVENKVQGDGNCQFRALSDQLYRSPEHHRFVRHQIVQQLKSRPEMYNSYVPMAFGDYLKKMSKGGEWGDHVTLQAAADSYGVKIFVITSFKETCYIEILPHILKSKRVIYLSFWAEVHYNSIYPEGELPEPSDCKKKNWWDRLEFYYDGFTVSHASIALGDDVTYRI